MSCQPVQLPSVSAPYAGCGAADWVAHGPVSLAEASQAGSCTLDRFAFYPSVREKGSIRAAAVTVVPPYPPDSEAD